MSDDDAAMREVIRRLDVLGGGPDVVRVAAGQLLRTLEPLRAAELLQVALQLSRARWEPAVKVLPAMLQALYLEESLLPHRQALRQVAALHEHHEVSGILGEGQPVQEYEAQAAAKADAKLFSLPLGVLKSRARLTKDPDELSRLAAASHPSVIREILKNPRLTEPLVVRIAARRPARAEALEEIWKAPRWNTQPEVRKALVWNPYLSVELAVKIAPLLPQRDLLELRENRNVHPAVRDLAQRLTSSGSAR